MFPINRCPTLCVVLLVLHFVGDAEAATANASCLLQASETRLQTNHSDATVLDPHSWPVVELVNFLGNKSDRRFQAVYPGFNPPGTNLIIQWALAIGIVLAGSWTLFQEAQVASSQDQGGKKRDALWDVTRSALMVLIINYHLCQMYLWVYVIFGAPIDYWFTGFYMPAFFMISGMFSKRRGDSYWSNILVNNVINACLFAPIYAPVFSPYVRNLWFLWALAAYRGFLQPALAACHGHLGQWMGAGAGLLVAVVLNYAVTAMSPWWFAVLNIEQNDLVRIGFHAIFFAVGFAMDAATVRRFLQHKITLALSLLHISFLVWVCYNGTYFQSKDLKMKLFNEEIPEDFMPFSYPLGWTLTVAQRTLASLSFIALLVPLVDAESSSMRFLCQLFALSGKRTLYGYCLQFICMERLGMVSLQMVIDDQLQEYIPMWPFYMFPHQCLQVLFMFSLCSPLAERAFHFMVSPEWVLDCFRAGAKALPAPATK